MVKALVLVAYMLLLLLPARAQQAAQPVQFSGITVTEDSLGILPYVTILVKNRYKGTISDARGFFSFVALPGDTIQFSAIGYRNNYYLMPEAERDLHSVIMPLEKDTIELPMAVIYPWPSKEAFREAFLALQLDDDMYDIARKNLEGQLLAEISQKMTMDGSENQKLFMQKMIAQTYYAGGQQNFHQMGGPGGIPIPSTLLNPFAWAEFVKAVKRGDFKRK